MYIQKTTKNETVQQYIKQYSKVSNYNHIQSYSNYAQNKQPMAVTFSWQDGYISKMTCKPSKLGQTDIVFGLWSSVGLCMRDYKSLRIAVMICATMVNTHTHMHAQTVFNQLYY